MDELVAEGNQPWSTFNIRHMLKATTAHDIPLQGSRSHPVESHDVPLSDHDWISGKHPDDPMAEDRLGTRCFDRTVTRTGLPKSIKDHSSDLAPSENFVLEGNNKSDGPKIQRLGSVKATTLLRNSGPSGLMDTSPTQHLKPKP